MPPWKTKEWWLSMAGTAVSLLVALGAFASADQPAVLEAVERIVLGLACVVTGAATVLAAWKNNHPPTPPTDPNDGGPKILKFPSLLLAAVLTSLLLTPRELPAAAPARGCPCGGGCLCGKGRCPDRCPAASPGRPACRCWGHKADCCRRPRRPGPWFRLELRLFR